MLTRIAITNYLLIDSLELEWQQGLTAITGETGSGKSILIGALELALGARADAGLLRDPSKRCAIELELDLVGLGLGSWFATNELPYEENALLRRQLDPGGRSRAFVNDTPVRLEQLRELGERLIHIHSQHHTLLLNDARFQLGLVDQLAGQEGAVKELGVLFTDWRSAGHALDEARAEHQRAVAEADFVGFQLEELEQAAITEGEHSRIEDELRLAEHAGERAEAYRAIEEGASGDQGAAVLLQRLRALVSKAARIDPVLAGLLQRVEGAAIELKDVGAEAARLAASVEVDPGRAEMLRDRIDLLIRLQQKHRAPDEAGLINVLAELRQRASAVDDLSERCTALEKESQRLAAAYAKEAKAISLARTKAIKPLSNKVEALLHQLGMPHAVFQFDHRTGEPGPYGIDQVRALFTANKDRAPAPLDKVASGGELSRVMLALISLAAGSRDLPVVVFDEIDTGVSGEVADRVGALLSAMGKERQVIAITHLPQIASKASHHLQVTKDADGDRVRTAIAPLRQEERVEAIARMLSGRKVTEQALENARVLLEQR
ncbi:MAG: DNA repair protein RecN [Flavobacteriales bacterium]|jgi:DNA repair protein RecN (Recombination protein N)|nr:DNA repair protein RecN [Flavobacteriales bacterium]